jgi:uncharacterized protein YbjT (DUF2867 family)
MTTAAVFGCTGAVGSQILATLLTTDTFFSVKTISRRLPTVPVPSHKLEALQEADISRWAGMISSLSPKPSTVFNAVGSTRHNGLKEQWKIDHDSVVDNAKAAKEAGVTTYVFISSGGTRWPLAGYLPYLKMKIGVEDAIKALGFEQAIILKPGIIIGRETSKAPIVEKMAEGLSLGIRDKIGNCG